MEGSRTRDGLGARAGLQKTRPPLEHRLCPGLKLAHRPVTHRMAGSFIQVHVLVLTTVVTAMAVTLGSMEARWRARAQALADFQCEFDWMQLEVAPGMGPYWGELDQSWSSTRFWAAPHPPTHQPPSGAPLAAASALRRVNASDLFAGHGEFGRGALVAHLASESSDNFDASSRELVKGAQACHAALVATRGDRRHVRRGPSPWHANLDGSGGGRRTHRLLAGETAWCSVYPAAAKEARLLAVQRANLGHSTRPLARRPPSEAPLGGLGTGGRSLAAAGCRRQHSRPAGARAVARRGRRPRPQRVRARTQCGGQGCSGPGATREQCAKRRRRNGPRRPPVIEAPSVRSTRR